MAELWIDFYGGCKAEANNREQATNNFWLWYNQTDPCFGVGKHTVSIDYMPDRKENTAEFSIEFSGFCKVEAKNKRQAKKNFWSWYNLVKPCFGIKDHTMHIAYVGNIGHYKEEEG